MAQRGYCQFSVLGHDKEFFVATKFSSPMSRQWVLVLRHVGSGQGEARATAHDSRAARATARL